jgi:alginate O-acetyltransferase complex protein AlgI
VLFNSWEFALFFLVVYVIYLLLPNFRRQNILLLVASYYFYAAWDWRFLFLIFSSTVLDFVGSIQIDASSNPRIRKMFLVASIVANLTLLGFFKYFNFFLDSLRPILMTAGLSVEQLHLHIMLPVGISFYTFQEMSYTIDVSTPITILSETHRIPG